MPASLLGAKIHAKTEEMTIQLQLNAQACDFKKLIFKCLKYHVNKKARRARRATRRARPLRVLASAARCTARP